MTSKHLSHRSSSQAGSLTRRAWLARGAAGLALTVLGRGATAADLIGKESKETKVTDEALAAARREVIRPLLYSREDLDRWLAGKAFPFAKYDPELGYLHIDRRFREGVDGAICTYNYDSNGARRGLEYPGQPCRVNTYGNSFTACEEVSDHETWQEVLAGHLGEPIRNFGIGGYSVYQAYLRMRREEQRVPAKYIIFNIYDDDSYRNLNGWQRPRFRVRRIAADPPVPHVKADPDTQTFIECPNPCPTPESLYQLCDLDKAATLFAQDYGINRMARREVLRAQGITPPESEFYDPDYTRSALYATMRILELVERFASQEKRQVLYVLSCGAKRIRRFVKEGKRFDSSLAEFVHQRGLNCVDLLDAHVNDLGKADLETYLARHFVVAYKPGKNAGHYTPQGNLFCAFALKDKLVQMLQPPPPAYAPSSGEDI